MKKTAKSVLLTISLTTSLAASAQTSEMPKLNLELPKRNQFSSWRPEFNPRDPTNPTYVRETAVYRVPVSITESDRWLALAVVGTTILAFANERDMLEFVQKNDGHVANKVAKFAEPFGGQLAGAGLIAGEVYALVADDGETARFFKLAFKAGVTTGLINDAIKLSLHRALPSETRDPFAQTNSNRPTDLAFPSSHASSAFSLATVIAETYGKENSVIPILAYGVATATAWSRVYDNQHWLSDVIVGAFIGHFVALQFTRTETRGGVEVTPFFTREGSGVQLSYSEKQSWESIRPRECRRDSRHTPILEACLAATMRK